MRTWLTALALLIAASCWLPQGPALADSGSLSPIGKAARQIAADLLDQLKSAKDEATARDLEQRIWQAWLRSGSTEIDELVRQSMMLMQLRRFDLALAILDSVVSKAPDFAEGWNKRATLLYVMGDLERSLADIDKVLALEPRHFGAISGIGLIRMAKGDKKGALEAYRRVLDIDPLSATARESVEVLSKEVEGDPT